MIYLLVILLFFEFLFSIYCFRGNFFCPANIFSLTFLIASINLIFCIDYWNVKLHLNTVVTVCGGVIVFEIVCIIVHKIKRHKKAKNGFNLCCLESIKIDNWKLDICIVLNIIIVIAVWYSITKILKNCGVYQGALSSFGIYHNLVTSRMDISLPTLINYTYLICRTSGYIWLYIVIFNFNVNKKVNARILINFIVTAFSYLLTGGRAGMVFLLLSGIPIYFYLYCKKKGNIIKLPLKTVKKITILLFSIAFMYGVIGNIIGRDIKSSAYEHFSINLSAPIVNLDISLQKNWKKPNIWGHTTFAYLINTIGRKFNKETWIHTLDMHFQYANGHPLGNVFTTFYPFYHDFSYKGVIILTSGMALIMQTLYCKLLSGLYKNQQFNMVLIVYSRFLILIGFSFFSNKLYETVFTISFWEEIFVEYFIIFFFRRISIRGEKI